MIFGRILEEIDTPYQRITWTVLPSGKHAMFLDEEPQFLEGLDERIYHHALAAVPARMVGGPFRALILGGGDGLAARSLLELSGCLGVTMVELDPDVVSFSRKHPVMKKMNRNVFEHPRLDVRIGDARKFIELPPRQLYETVIVDFPDPTPPGAFDDLYSEEFYRRLSRHLGGFGSIVSIQSSGPAEGLFPVVQTNLSAATNRIARVIRFVCDETEDGYAVYGGAGAHAAIPNAHPLDRRVVAV